MMSKVAIIRCSGPQKTGKKGVLAGLLLKLVEGELPIDLIQNHYPLGKVPYSVVFSKIPYSYE